MRFIPVFIAACFLLIACGPERAPTAAETPSGPESSSGERKIKYWVAPMDPTYISDKPGKSPMGMDLVPVYEGEAPGASAPGAVTIDPAVVQNMGVRVEPARRQSVFRHVRSIGEIEVGEDQISVVNLRFSGWVERIHVDRTGDPVEQGQPLFEIYSPDLVAAQEEYLLALRTQGANSELARSARRKFDLWDIAAEEIAGIAESSKVRRTLAIRSPRTGFVLDKNVVEGARVMAGQDLYRIGDLRHIWVTAEIYEFDAPWVEVGQPAQMELSYEEGKAGSDPHDARPARRRRRAGRAGPTGDALLLPHAPEGDLRRARSLPGVRHGSGGAAW